MCHSPSWWGRHRGGNGLQLGRWSLLTQGPFRQGGDWKWMWDYKPSGLLPRNPVPLARLHLSKVLKPPQIVPPARCQVFQHMNLWGTRLVMTCQDPGFQSISSLLSFKSQFQSNLLSQEFDCSFSHSVHVSLYYDNYLPGLLMHVLTYVPTGPWILSSVGLYSVSHKT